MAAKPSHEHGLQSDIQNDLAGECLMFRANVGTGWQSNQIKRFSRNEAFVAQRGDLLLRNARPFSTGLPAGFSDLFGLTRITITQEMVGKSIGVFFAMEVKDQAKASPEQKLFLNAIKQNGGISGIAYSTEDARKIVRKPSAKMMEAQKKLIEELIEKDLIYDTRQKGGDDDQ